MIQLETLLMTCDACPSQWSGRTVDGREVYIRYRWGRLTAHVALAPCGTGSDAASQPPIFVKEVGGEFGGVMDTEELAVHLKDVFEFPKEGA